jgi:uncharacterized protein with HEPN domain
MKKDDLVYVGHMLDLAEQALEKMQGKNRDDFDGDDNLRLAITHLVQTMGEAARQVSADYQAAHPDIEWHEIVGTRHRIVHDYINVDFDTVWEIETFDLPRLVPKLKKILPPE